MDEELQLMINNTMNEKNKQQNESFDSNQKGIRAVVIGSGISGMTAAVKLAQAGVFVTLVSPFPSERSQSVMAAGGINAVLKSCDVGDSVESHIEDTLKGGAYLAGEKAVKGLCSSAEKVIEFLEQVGTVFTVDEKGQPEKRVFGGQSHKRTCFSGSSTGKQIVSGLVMETRRYEAKGLIKRMLWSCFHSALIKDGVCYGVIIFNETTRSLEEIYGDAVIIATGGQNSLFGKTTGSTQCDGYTAGKLFMQGAALKNLEFIQYHPTTLETTQKKMLISEAVRGEGGRLFYLENGKRVYFLEDKYGPKGNLLTRDVLSREIEACGREVFLDISFLEPKEIEKRIPEVKEVCQKYRGIDICKEPIPVSPSVHFFMGGLAVHLNHETNIKNLFAIGECASIYHGANRLGGNSLLSAVYSGMIASEEIIARGPSSGEHPDFSEALQEAQNNLRINTSEESKFPAAYIKDMVSETISKNLGIVRREESLKEGISDIDYYLSVADKISYDNSVMIYDVYSLKGILALAKAVLTCALARCESRGAHYREDYPESKDELKYASIIMYEEGDYRVDLDREMQYEN